MNGSLNIIILFTFPRFGILDPKLSCEVLEIKNLTWFSRLVITTICLYNEHNLTIGLGKLWLLALWVGQRTEDM